MKYKDDNQDDNEVVGLADVFENIVLVIDHSTVKEVEELQHNEDIEDIGEVDAGFVVEQLLIVSVYFSSLDNHA